MNRDHQTHMGPSDACYYADHRGCPFPTMCECSCHKSLAGDSTPPATPPEPLCPSCRNPEKHHAAAWLCGDKFHHGVTPPATPVEPPECTCDLPSFVGCSAHPPAVSGEGERLKEQAAAYRAIALDALACWQGEDEHSDDNQRRNRSARSRATLRHRICAVDDTVRASTPTPGTPR